MAKIVGLKPATAKTVKELLRGRHDGPSEIMPEQDTRWANNRVALVQAVSFGVPSASTGSQPKNLWTANVVLVDDTLNVNVVGTCYLYDIEDNIVVNKVYVAIEQAPDALDGTPIFVTMTFAGLPSSSSSSPGSSSSGGSSGSSSSGVSIITDVSCDQGGLDVDFGTLTGVVQIGGNSYPVSFSISGASGS